MAAIAPAQRADAVGVRFKIGAGPGCKLALIRSGCSFMRPAIRRFAPQGDLDRCPGMNSRSVQVSRMIVRTGSLASAAERLGMSPSAASRMVATLESELEPSLFSRQNRKLHPMDQGAISCAGRSISLKASNV